MKSTIQKSMSFFALLFLFCLGALGVQSNAKQNEMLYLPIIRKEPWTGYEGWVLQIDDMYVRDVVESDDGRFVAVGRYLADSYNGAVLMVDGEGTLIWMKLHQIGIGIFNDLHKTAEGDFIAVGASYSTEGIPIVKHGPDGTVIWQRWMSVDGLDTVASDITADGGLIVAGGEIYRPFIWRFDQNGGVMWQKELGGVSNNMITTVIQLSDGGFVAAGQTAVVGAGNWDGWVVRLDAIGNVIWQKVYGTAASDEIQAVQTTADGGVIAVGGTRLFGSSTGWVLKLDGTGQVQWSKSFSRFDNSEMIKVLAMDDGRYLLSGVSNYSDPYEEEGWQVKLAADGSILWQHGIGTYGNYGPMQEVTDGGLIMAGFWGMLLRMNDEGYVFDCQLIHGADGAATNMPVTVGDYPYGPGPSTHMVGGTWFYKGETPTTTLLCPQGGSTAVCRIGMP